jgi:hypothetical protein
VPEGLTFMWVIPQLYVAKLSQMDGGSWSPRHRKYLAMVVVVGVGVGVCVGMLQSACCTLVRLFVERRFRVSSCTLLLMQLLVAT